MGDMYIAIDGDSVGIRLQQLILEERLEELKAFSNSIHDTLLSFVRILEKHGAVVYMHGGDNIFAKCTRECAQIVSEYVAVENKRNRICYSLAIGKNTQDTYMGLQYAKSSKHHYIEVVREGEKILFRDVDF